MRDHSSRAAGRYAVRTLRSLEDAAGSVGELTSLRSGTVALGTFNAPAPWRLDQLVARGVGDTYVPSAYTRAPGFPEGLATASFTPALHDTFAVITRRAARLSPAARELIGDLEAHMQAVASDLDRTR